MSADSEKLQAEIGALKERIKELEGYADNAFNFFNEYPSAGLLYDLYQKGFSRAYIASLLNLEYGYSIAQTGALCKKEDAYPGAEAMEKYGEELLEAVNPKKPA